MVMVVYPGSFDPFTLGHLDVVRRAAALFDVVVVGVARNLAKSPLLPLEARAELAESSVRDVPGVRVEVVPGLLAEFCRQRGADAVVKGLRGGGDYAAEQPMALMNRHLGVETVFITADPVFSHISSSMVKEVARYGGPIDDLVPRAVADRVRAAVAGRAEGAAD